MMRTSVLLVARIAALWRRESTLDRSLLSELKATGTVLMATERCFKWIHSKLGTRPDDGEDCPGTLVTATSSFVHSAPSASVNGCLVWNTLSGVNLLSRWNIFSVLSALDSLSVL